MCGKNTIGCWATFAGGVLLLGLVITTLLVNILGGGGDAEEILSLGKNMVSVPSQVFQEEQTGGISMFNVHLPTAIGSGVLVLVAIILLYLCYRRMQKRQMDLARNGQGERGNERELNVLYSAPPLLLTVLCSFRTRLTLVGWLQPIRLSTHQRFRRDQLLFQWRRLSGEMMLEGRKPRTMPSETH